MPTVLRRLPALPTRFDRGLVGLLAWPLLLVLLSSGALEPQ